MLGSYKFSFLPWFLKNLGIYGNYTFTRSEAYVYKRTPANEYTRYVINSTYTDPKLKDPSATEKLKSMPGQAEHNANLSLFYEGDRLYAKLSANYQSDFLYSLGLEKDFDEYYAASLHLDFNAHFKITKSIKVFADVLNLTNTPLVYFQNNRNYILKREYYSWTARIGLKLNF
ncbi:MAG: TonB-dependent receptor [Bacteroidales bacterium]|nr:TonB-dependent receptor [Bacteroidales bacterium]